MNKVNLFIVGAPRCGTTAWSAYLASHKRIRFSDRKEPHYFCDDFPGLRWAKTEAAYEKFFLVHSGDHAYHADASPMYLYSRVAAANIHRYNPDANILIFLRGHGEFLRSYHRQLLNIFEEDLTDLSAAWKAQPARALGKMIPPCCREPTLLQYARVATFADQIERYLRFFGKEKVKVLLYEDWVPNPLPAYKSVLDFLGLKYDGRTEFPKANEAYRMRSRGLGRILLTPPKALVWLSSATKIVTGKSRLGVAAKLTSWNRVVQDAKTCDTDLLDQLKSRWSEDVTKLEQLLDRNLSDWKTVP